MGLTCASALQSQQWSLTVLQHWPEGWHVWLSQNICRCTWIKKPPRSIGVVSDLWKQRLQKFQVRLYLLLNRNFTVVIKPTTCTHQNNFPRHGRTQVSAQSIITTCSQAGTITKSNFMSRLQTTKPWLMSTTVATSCQSTTHVIFSKFRILAINRKFVLHVSKLQFSTIAPTFGFATRAVLRAHAHVQTQNCQRFHKWIRNKGLMIMLPTLPTFWTSDLLSWLTLISALWTGSCCQVYPYPSQYHPEPSSHQ